MERVDRVDRMVRAERAERLGRAAVDWMLHRQGADWDEPSLYHGRAGILLAVHEAHAHFGDGRYSDAVDRGADAIAAGVDQVEDSSLYFGLTGIAYTLHALGRDGAARRALRLVRERCNGGRWSQMFELFAGNAGVGLGALCVGDVDLAVDAVTPYRSAATRTAYGVNWPVRPTPPRSHHIAHGTLDCVRAGRRRAGCRPVRSGAARARRRGRRRRP